MAPHTLNAARDASVVFLKIGVAILVLLTSTGAIVFRIKYADSCCTKTAMELCNVAAAGMFIGMALNHLLPEASELAPPLDHPVKMNMVGLCAFCGFTFILLCERVFGASGEGGARVTVEEDHDAPQELQQIGERLVSEADRGHHQGKSSGLVTPGTAGGRGRAVRDVFARSPQTALSLRTPRRASVEVDIKKLLNTREIFCECLAKECQRDHDLLQHARRRISRESSASTPGDRMGSSTRSTMAPSGSMLVEKLLSASEGDGCAECASEEAAAAAAARAGAASQEEQHHTVGVVLCDVPGCRELASCDVSCDAECCVSPSAGARGAPENHLMDHGGGEGGSCRVLSSGTPICPLDLEERLHQHHTSDTHSHGSSSHGRDGGSSLGGAVSSRHEHAHDAHDTNTPHDVDGHDGHDHHGVSAAYVIMLALSMHSIFEGLVIGMAATVNAVLLVSACVVCHKWAAAFALGTAFANARIPQKRALICLMIFAVASPFGTVLGMILSVSVSSYGQGLLWEGAGNGLG